MRPRKVRRNNNVYLGTASGGKLVIPSPHLENYIYNESLEGALISVLLEPHGNGHGYYVASLDERDITPKSKIDWHSIPSALLIDGQNLMGSIRGTPMSLTAAVQKIYASVPLIREARLYFCTQTGTAHDNLYEQEMHKLRTWGKIEIIDRAPKIIWDGNGTRQKETDIDALMLPEIPYLMLKGWIQGLVIVTGDSDYEEALKMWAGIGKYKMTGERPLKIISTGGDIAKELRILTNNPHVEFSELKHL